MGCRFPTRLIGELATSGALQLQTGPFGSQLHKEDYVASGTPVIPTEAIGRGRIRADVELPMVSSSKAAELARHRLRVGDILFARRGIQATGLAARIDQSFDGALCGTGAILLRVDQEIVDSQFLVAFLATGEAFNWLRTNAVGAVMPNLNTGIISGLAIPMPAMDVQRELGGFLSTLDDRIDNLRATNATLEAIAQTLFKSWFVDFDPVHAKAEGREPVGMDAATAALFPCEFEDSELGPIPKGWRWVNAGDAFDVGIGKTPPRKERQWFTADLSDVPWASIRDMGDSGCFIAYTSEFLTRDAIDRFHVRMVPAGTVLMSFKLTVGRVAITDREMTTNEAIAHFKSKAGSPPQTFLYCYLKSFDMGSLDSTSSIATATNSKAIRQLPMTNPGDELANAFDRSVGPLFEQIQNQQRQAGSLVQLRDALLPRLISGKLRLPDAASVAVPELG